jgi:hypothetical protein
VLRAGEGRELKRLQAYAPQVNAIEDDFEKLTDDGAAAETDKFRRAARHGESIDRLLPEAFAAVREASKRTLGKRHFDVQIMGGAALHFGNIAEMKTGEGKTLVATLPAYLNALVGKGVHVVTVNDYLAKYQSELMGRVHRIPRPGDRLHPAAHDPRGAPRSSTPSRHHLRHQQRVRLRLPARQHGLAPPTDSSSAATTSPSSTRSTRSSSTRPAPR